MVPILALPGCIATRVASTAPNCWQSHGAPRWGQCLGDVPLSALIARAQLPTPPWVQDKLSGDLASRYIALRAQQTALVLLADRENLDSQLVTVARQASGAASGQAVRAAETQLANTRSDQARTRTQIAALRVRLAVLSGLALGALDRLPAGPIPLPPPAPGMTAGLAQYRVAAAAAAAAQAAALAARSAAMQQILRTRAAGRLAPGEALAADRRALAALQAEEQARAAMAQAYVALGVGAAGR